MWEFFKFLQREFIGIFQVRFVKNDCTDELSVFGNVNDYTETIIGLKCWNKHLAFPILCVRILICKDFFFQF